MWVEEKMRDADGRKSEAGEKVMDWERRMACSSSPSSYMLLGFSSAAMLAVLASSSILMVVVFSVSMRKKKSDPLSPVKDDEIRENIITYDDEGGGEEDTVAFDITALKSAPHTIHTRGVGPAPVYGPLCYSIHTLSESPFVPLQTRTDWNKLAHPIPRGYTLNVGLLEKGSTFRGPSEMCNVTGHMRTGEESRGSAESVHEEKRPGESSMTGTLRDDQAPLVLSDSSQSADPPVVAGPHLHPSIASSITSDDITPSHKATEARGRSAAPFRTMEGTLLRTSTATLLYPNPALNYTQHLVGTYASGRGLVGPELGHGANLVRIGDLLQHRLALMTFDPMQPPYDSLRMYEYEGGGSDTTSLSSIESLADGGVEGEMFNEWGPKFVKLLEMFGQRGGEESREGDRGAERKEVEKQEESG